MKRNFIFLSAGLTAMTGILTAGCGSDPDDTTTGQTSTTSTASTTASSSSTAGSGGQGGQGGQGGGSGGQGGTGGMGGSGGMSNNFTSQGPTSYETEAYLAADDTGGIVACWIGFHVDITSTIGYAVSRDGGLTWTPPKIIDAPDGRESSDPVCASDGQGGFWLAWLGFRFNSGMKDEHIFLSQLDPATETFGTPTMASDDGTNTNLDFDKPWLTTDATGATLVTWADFTGQLSVWLAKSSDGMNFTRTMVVGDSTAGNLAYTCLDKSQGPSAPLYLVHYGNGATLILRKSTDGGMTWTPTNVPVNGVVFEDPTCVVSGNDVWISYGYGTSIFVPGESAPADEVRVVHSGDGGTTFDMPVTVSSGAPGTLYLFPQLMRTATGQLETVYYSGQKNQPATLVNSFSTDGTTWTTMPVTTAGTFTVSRTTPDWLGDYVGLGAANGGVYTAFADNTGGKAHVRFAQVK